MSTASTIADYIRHKRSLGIRFDHGATVLSTFSRSVGKMPLRDIRPETITRFINREGISAETMAKQHGVLAGFFRYAVTRRPDCRTARIYDLRSGPLHIVAAPRSARTSLKSSTFW